MQAFGGIYVAFGAPYLAMTLLSAASLRLFNPAMPVCIVTNMRRSAPDLPWWNPRIGDTWLFVDETSQRNRHYKTGVYELSPFENTVFLDSDTMVLGDPAPLHSYLRYFDVLLTPVYEPAPKKKLMTILDGQFRYSEDGHFNSGVFGFRRSEGAKEFFQLWNSKYHALGYTFDEPSFLDAVFVGKARLLPLPAKWNTGDKWLARSAVREEIVVWHYKMRMEAEVEKLLVKAVSWFDGSAENLEQVREFIRIRRQWRHHNTAKWQFRKLLTSLRGNQSRRLLLDERSAEWRRWTS